MTYDLALDEPRKQDDVYSFGNVHVLVDKSSQVYMEENLTIDYDESIGAYRLKSPERVIPGVFYV
ncbi:iron-sulfur cluster biosynthesis family protein [Effusibacillus pohliae]|uniref:iron-sulfur cluster biosynthesis family protein n=1 Tax=Effusibacillus pohliae TaxID=232270 RepID=UPI00036B9997|nr:iron-sulfur cluster biosynthesis family protein [Effusibacillus pohliae]